MSNLLYQAISPNDVKKQLNVQIWWEIMMAQEPHMLYEPTSKIIQTLIEAIVAYDGTKLVAASGVFLARTKGGKPLIHLGQDVAEIGSIVVDPAYRGQGIGKILTEKSIKLAWQKDLLPVSVSTNPTMQHIFRQFGGKTMDDSAELSALRQALCLCVDPSPDCKLCPLAKEGGWIFSSDCCQRREYSDFHGC